MRIRWGVISRIKASFDIKSSGNSYAGLKARHLSCHFFCNYINTLSASRAIINYNDKISLLTQENKNELLKEAAQYNEHLYNTSSNQNIITQYNDILNIDGNGLIGSIRISKINVNLPIYHGIESAVLNKAVGHIEGTSFPIGGNNTHAVLSGHRGLPSAELFTRLDELKIGDQFSINILDQIIYYEVENIYICGPDDKTYLQIEEGKDLCTLMTCTPYGINTERLLVRGHRIDNPYGTANISNELNIIQPFWLILTIICIVCIFGFIWIFIKNKRPRLANKKELDNLHDTIIKDLSKKN